MGTLSMKVLIVLVSVVACAVAQNVVCNKGTTNKEVTVEDKKTYTFKTQKGKKYPGNTKCTVNYKMGDSCKKMSFACTKISQKGDKLTVTANGKSKSYCKPKPKPKVSSTGDLSVVFTSDKKKSAAGAVCKVKCTEAAGSSTESIVLILGASSKRKSEVFFPRTGNGCIVKDYRFTVGGKYGAPTLNTISGKTILCGGYKNKRNCYEFTPSSKTVWT